MRKFGSESHVRSKRRVRTPQPPRSLARAFPASSDTQRGSGPSDNCVFLLSPHMLGAGSGCLRGEANQAAKAIRYQSREWSLPPASTTDQRMLTGPRSGPVTPRQARSSFSLGLFPAFSMLKNVLLTLTLEPFSLSLGLPFQDIYLNPLGRVTAKVGHPKWWTEEPGGNSEGLLLFILKSRVTSVSIPNTEIVKQSVYNQ